MKKLIGLIAVAIIMSMAACTENTPGPIVEKALNNFINGDYEAFADVVDFGEDSLPENDVKKIKNTAISTFKKVYEGIKNGNDEQEKKKLLKSCKVLDEQIDGNEAVVEVELTTVGGDVKNSKIFLKKNKAGEWKIKNAQDIMPQAKPAQGNVSGAAANTRTTTATDSVASSAEGADSLNFSKEDLVGALKEAGLDSVSDSEVQELMDALNQIDPTELDNAMKELDGLLKETGK